MTKDPRVQTPAGVQKREVKLYGITGWFGEPMGVICGAFGGYFRHDVLDKLVVDGQLVDCYGASDISGKMTEEELVFVKQYADRLDTIRHSFTKQNGIWVGQYEGAATGLGQSKCRTFLVEEDAFGIVCGPPRTEYFSGSDN